jgi:hypothetical protein
MDLRIKIVSLGADRFAFAWIKIRGVCLTADCFAFGELLDKAPSNQGLVLPVGPDFVGFLHSGLAPWARAERTSLS